MGIQINGQTDTVTAIDGSINVGGNVTIPGVLTYEDVTNVDSVGIVTAQSGIHVTGGSVGIGTDNPQHKLNVYNATASNTGGILVQNVTYANNQDKPYLTVGTTNWDGSTNSTWNTFGFQHRVKSNSAGTGRITVDTSGGERFCIENGGNVGIGTDNPGQLLHLNGADARILLTETTNNSNCYLDYASPGVLEISVDDNDVDANSKFQVRIDGATAALTLDSSGRLLLGTTVPNSFNGVGGQHNLIVAGAASTTNILNNSAAAITISNTDGTADNTAGLHFAREDTDTTPHYTGASIVSQFKEAQVTGQYPKADLAFLTSTAANHAPSEKLRITAAGDILPGSDNTQDLGSATKRFANLYTGDLQLSNEGSANDVDGTWGQYTIQEGEDDLFLINRRTGKKYKFNITEVN